LKQEKKSKENKQGRERNLPSMTTNLMTMVFYNKKFRGKHILVCNNHHDMKATNKPKKNKSLKEKGKKKEKEKRKLERNWKQEKKKKESLKEET